MIIIIYGPAGSGKGTQARIIAKKLGLKHFSMGDALRGEIKKKTLIGRKIASMVNSGRLVPSSITNTIVLNTYSGKGTVLDGYPRNFDQLKFIMKHFRVDFAFELNISDKEVIKRMSARRICPKCGRNYNTIWIKPKKAGYCDVCNIKLMHRDDDKPAQIRQRLKIYHQETLPLRKHYAKIGVLHIVDGSGTIEKVNMAIMRILKNGR